MLLLLCAMGDASGEHHPFGERPHEKPQPVQVPRFEKREMGTRVRDTQTVIWRRWPASLSSSVTIINYGPKILTKGDMGSCERERLPNRSI